MSNNKFNFNEEFLSKILNPEARKELLEEIFGLFESYSSSNLINLEYLEISDGKIPVLTFNKPQNLTQIKRVLIFVASQHNEYSGLFGQIAYLQEISSENSELVPKDPGTMMIFFPLMNPYGFLNPREDNKSGYYLNNGANLNRFWRKTFIPNYLEDEQEVASQQLPENCVVFKKYMEDYWDREIEIFLFDFHETSLFRRYSEDMAVNLNAFYKFEHEYKMWIVQYLTRLEDLPKREPLFVQPGQCIDHHHFNLNINQGEKLLGDFRKAWESNRDKIPFFYIYNSKSRDFCSSIAHRVQEELKDVMWDVRKPSNNHLHNHGCFVCLGHSTTRPNTFTCELELDKQFFNLFEEIDKCNNDQSYFNKKLENINREIEIVKETIKQIVH